MNKPDIVGMQYPFDIYLNKVITISETCPREINYQLEIIKPFLENVFKDYQIVDTSDNSEPKKSTKNPKHNRYIYTIKDGAAPDLLIAKGYKYENNKKGVVQPQIYCSVEVKEQASYEMFNKDVESYSIDVINQIATYFCRNEKVILTNCRRWQFFDRRKIENIDLDLFENYLTLARNYFKIDKRKIKDEDVKDFCKEIRKKIYNSNDYIRTEINQIEETSEWLYKCKKILENYIRIQISSSVVNTIDVLPNKGVVYTDKYKESVRMDEVVEELLGVTTDLKTNIIKTPIEWNEMISYLKKFVLSKVKIT